MRKILTGIIAAVILIISFTACDISQTQSSLNNADAACHKLGCSPKITNYYDYQQMIEIYESRDNPDLVLNAYISAYDGTLVCLGKVLGFGIPYGTQMSPPYSGTQAVPEPNGLYPSENTNADWIRLLGPDGKPHLTFAEPNLIITDMVLPCKELTNGKTS